MGLGEQKKEHSLNSSQRSRVHRVNLWVSQLKSGINRRFRVLNARFRDEGAGRGENRSGYLVEHDDTQKIFTNPTNDRTEEYITGRFS